MMDEFSTPDYASCGYTEVAAAESESTEVPEQDLFGQAEDATDQYEQTVRDAIARVRAEEKPNAALGPATIEALARIEAANPALFGELRHELKGLQRFGVLVGTVDKHIRQAARELGLVSEVADEKAVADLLVEAALDLTEVFVDQEGEPHLTVYESPRKTLLLQSKAAKEWFSWLCFNTLQRSASETVLGTAITTLSGIARHAGAGEIPAHLPEINACEIYITSYKTIAYYLFTCEKYMLTLF